MTLASSARILDRAARSIKLSLIGLPLRDLFSKPPEEASEQTIQLDYKPPQELVGALGAGMVAGGTLLTDMILYQNTHLPEQTVSLDTFVGLFWVE